MAVVDRDTARAAAEVIRDEVAVGANTAARVGGLMVDVVDSMAFFSESGRIMNAASMADSDVATLSGLATTIDGVLYDTDGMVAVLQGQTDPIENGAWVVHAGAWTRPEIFPTGGSASGFLFYIEGGSTYADQTWAVSTDAPNDVIGTDGLTLQRIAGQSWANTLAVSPSSGANSPTIASGQSVSWLGTAKANFGADPSTTGAMNFTAGQTVYVKATGPADFQIFQFRGDGGLSTGDVNTPAPMFTVGTNVSTYWVDGTGDSAWILLDGASPYAELRIEADIVFSAHGPSDAEPRFQIGEDTASIPLAFDDTHATTGTVRGGAMFSIYGLNAAEDTDRALFTWDTGDGEILTVGNLFCYVRLDATGDIELNIDGDTIARVDATGVGLITDAILNWDGNGSITGATLDVDLSGDFVVTADSLTMTDVAALMLYSGTTPVLLFDAEQAATATAFGILALPPADGHGADMNIYGQTGAGTDKDGGDIRLAPGAKTGAGTVGKVRIQSSAFADIVVVDPTAVTIASGTYIDFAEISIRRATIERVASSSTATWLNAPTGGTVQLQINGTPHLTIAASASTLLANVLRFDSTTASPVFHQADDATNSVTGDILSIRAQDCTGTTTTGGSLVMRPGTGTSAHGALRLRNGAGTDRFVINTTGIGFFAATPVAQAADPGALTDSSGGAADGTVAAISGTGDDADINNNFAELATKYNTLRTLLRNYGLAA